MYIRGEKIEPNKTIMVKHKVVRHFRHKSYALKFKTMIQLLIIYNLIQRPRKNKTTCQKFFIQHVAS